MNTKQANHRIEVLTQKARGLEKKAARYTTGSRRGQMLAEATKIKREIERVRLEVYGGQAEVLDDSFLAAEALFAVRNAERRTAKALNNRRK